MHELYTNLPIATKICYRKVRFSTEICLHKSTLIINFLRYLLISLFGFNPKSNTNIRKPIRYEPYYIPTISYKVYYVW